MSLAITICDDSSFARKQLARTLPASWDVSVTFASNGFEGLESVRQQKAEVLFLDLTMPELDGYGVLESIQQEKLNSVVIVVSGDIQPAARARVMSLGAMDFIKKPVDAEQLHTTLNKLGLITETIEGGVNQSIEDIVSSNISLPNIYREVANIAMGQAADLLAQHLDAFIVLPVPSVNSIEATELQMMLQSVHDSGGSAVFQGFIGNGIAGEALLIFDQIDFEDMARLLKFEDEINRNVEIELMMDIASILIGAFLKSYFRMIDVQFSQSHPKMLAENHVRDINRQRNIPWKKTMVIEIDYGIEGHDVSCDLLILFAEDSIEEMNNRIELFSP